MKRETEEKGKRERESLCAERGEEVQRERGGRGEKMGTKMSGLYIEEPLGRGRTRYTSHAL